MILTTTDRLRPAENKRNFMLYKRTVVTLLLMGIVGFSAFAETAGTAENTAPEYETLSKDKEVFVGGYGGPMMIVTSLNGKTVPAVGATGGVILNNFHLGLYGYGTLLDINTDMETLEGYGEGGFFMGYAVASHKVIHPVFGVALGAGSSFSGYYDDDALEGTDLDDDLAFRTFLVVTPQVKADINLTSFMRMSLGVGYRMNFEPWNGGYNEDWSGMTASLEFHFGKFH